ncbi:MAG TPA: hypothetical protein VFZ78_11885 [Flavisolibacter sp.]
MKKLLAHIVVTGAFLLFAQVMHAQLASDRPMAQVVGTRLKPKTGTGRTSPAVLPSEQAVPQQATAAKVKALKVKPAVTLTPEQQKKKLPGSKKQMPAVRKPRRP